MALDPAAASVLRAGLADAWPGAELAAEPQPLTGGFWAALYRITVTGQPAGIPSDLILRIAPDADMGTKELVVQRAVADLGYPTPAVRLQGGTDPAMGGTWSLMDLAPGSMPLKDLDGLGALRKAPGLLSSLPGVLATVSVQLHDLDPAPVTAAVAQAVPHLAWTLPDLLDRFAERAAVRHRTDLAAKVRRLAERAPEPQRLSVTHGDLHPLNLLVDEHGTTTVLDWNNGLLADPCFDVAYTSLILAHPPLGASGPMAAVIGRVGARMSKKFLAAYAERVPQTDLTNLDWYRGVHGARILVELTVRASEDPVAAAKHPFSSLVGTAQELLARAIGD
jgi:aminoglycoside phosphotransferase (APT) family kinase protein